MATLIGSLTVVLTAVMALSNTALAWNIPGHMLSGAIAYQVLQQESPETVDKVKAVLAKHPWYANQWQARLQDVPVADHGLVLFMQAARWPDDIRMRDKAKIDRLGITLIDHSNPKANPTPYKSETLTR
jgi:hypothetical protein